jgi:DNA-directed RNA polymerase II subunit RPB2
MENPSLEKIQHGIKTEDKLPFQSERMENPGICQPPESTKPASIADKAPAVLQRYFEHSNTFLTQHHITSYEACVFREIPDTILSENPLVILKKPLDTSKARNYNSPLTAFKYRTEIYVGGPATQPEDLAMDVGNPIITLDDGKTIRRMFPNEARLRNLTYASQFRADILIRTTFSDVVDGEFVSKEPVELTIPNFPLFKLPILLRSKLCATHESTQQLLQEMGECRNDQGGYFIVDGAEKVLITRQEQAFNTVFVQLKPANDLITKTYASVVCQHPVTKRTGRVSLFRLHQRDQVEDGAIRVSIPQIMGAIPLFVVFRLLGIESDEEIVRMIVPDGNTLSENSLIASIHDAFPVTTQALAIEFIRTLTKGFITESVLDIFHEQMFSHVPDKPMAKAQYLAEIVRKMLAVEQGKEPVPNRDDIRNQRLLPTGVLLRGLFAESWKLWKKSVISAIDQQFNYNEQAYSDENFMELFNPGNLNRVLATQELNDMIMRGFRGRWGASEFTLKSGVIQPVARISYMDAVSHTRRVISDFDTSLKLTGPRHLHPSQVGYFCTSETPTGGHIGATRNMSILTAISVAVPVEPVMNWLLTKGGVVNVADATQRFAAGATSVQINGGTIGFTSTPDRLTRVLKYMKWTGCLSPMASVSFNTADNTVRIYLDDGRPLRPLWHLMAGKWPAVASQQPLPSWRDLIMGTLPYTSQLPLSSTAFLDPIEDDATLEAYEALLEPHIGAIEFVDPYEGNEAYVSWWGSIADLSVEHTHAEIHPSTMMGAMASMIPYAPHNQSPRNQLSCSQSKQGIGYYATNYENRFDTYGSMLCYGEGAICRTLYHDAIAGGAMPYGTNLVFCINSFNGYNQDDGILFNRSSIQRGMFRSLSLRSYETVEEDDTMSGARYRMGNPKFVLSWTDVKPGLDYTALDENGVIREGTVIHDKSVLVGRYLMTKEGAMKDASLMPTVFTKGRVDKVVVLHQANGLRLVKVRILEERIPELGDKFSSRHGQKGTMGMLMDEQDMPRTKDGIVPDVMVNPHCIPSRMTMAQLLEQLFGRLGAEVGAKINATSFMNDDQSLVAIGDALEQLGIHRHGEEIMYSGLTGNMFTSSVFMGPLNFMRLKHLSGDKINARGAGRREQRTHQPTGGRGNEGGMRIGEMERDVLIAHGITDFLQESMMKRSDGTAFWVCNGCGTIPIVNESEKMFVCPMCDGPVLYEGTTADTISLVMPVKKSRVTFSRVEIPYAMKLLDQELTTYMNGGFRFLTEKATRRMKEPTVMEGEDVLDTVTPEEAVAKIDKAEVEVVKVGKPKVVEVVAEAEVVPVEGAADVEDEGNPAKNEVGEGDVPGEAAFEFNNSVNKEFGTYYASKMTVDGREWPTVEHYFQAMKFKANPEYQEKIRLAKTPAEANRLGKSKDVAADVDWERKKDEVMLEAQRVKFQDPKLREKLLATGTATMKSATPQDNYWGVGRSGNGKNKLGKLLMQIRDEIRSQGQGAQEAQEAPANIAVGDDAMFNPLTFVPMLPTSPPSLEVSPASLDVSPSSMEVSPASLDVSPSSMEVSPASLDVSPSSMEVSPASLDVSPSSMEASPEVERPEINIDLENETATIAYPPKKKQPLPQGWEATDEIKVVKV